jgi:hypothetical protein
LAAGFFGHLGDFYQMCSSSWPRWVVLLTRRHHLLHHLHGIQALHLFATLVEDSCHFTDVLTDSMHVGGQGLYVSHAGLDAGHLLDQRLHL